MSPEKPPGIRNWSTIKIKIYHEKSTKFFESWYYTQTQWSTGEIYNKSKIYQICFPWSEYTWRIIFSIPTKY